MVYITHVYKRQVRHQASLLISAQPEEPLLDALSTCVGHPPALLYKVESYLVLVMWSCDTGVDTHTHTHEADM